ncbi:hypothetical protein L6R50_26345 [Myxococcota bacterium]|nr:hypothetical protein [Myxococcota bacterium]
MTPNAQNPLRRPKSRPSTPTSAPPPPRAHAALAAGREMLGQVLAHGAAPETPVAHAARCLAEGLLDLCGGIHHTDPSLRREALHRSRLYLSLAAGHLTLGGGRPLPPQLASWVSVIEGELIPATDPGGRRRRSSAS